VGALWHYLEAEGVPTTQISLIREHTAAIGPPRALWVPFELGRPLGIPEAPQFQRRVLLSALELLEAPQGPVLEDFPEEAPEASAEADRVAEEWACPVGFASGLDEQSGPDALRSAFEREVAELRPWYDLSVEKRGRTALSHFSPDSAREFLDAFAYGEAAQPPVEGFPLAVALRLAAQDLKAFYFEALTARPGAASPASAAFERWFWKEALAGRVLRAVKERCAGQKDEALRKTGAMLLVPLSQS
jgi:hypothetical protein